MKTINSHPIGKVYFLHPLSFILLAALAACGTSPQRQEAPLPPPVAKAPPATPAPTAPPGQFPRSGGYYLDDGPGDKPPANLETIPDAVPRTEPLHRGAMRPYTVMGRNYVPMTAIVPYRARGVATWYGRRYHGKLTSIGEPYDMYAMTAAHPTLPLPSYVRVTSVANGRSVIVRVNDRGPFIDSRLIDLSYTAAHRLGIVTGGSALVDVELVQPGASGSAVVTAAAPPAPAAAVVPAVATVPTAAAPDARTASPDERAVPVTAEASGVYLQLAAFGSKENAEAYASRLRADVAWLATQLQVHALDGLFRVRAGPYASSGEAREHAERIGTTLGVKPVFRK